MLTGRTDVEAETPILWPPDAKNWLIWKGPNAGKDWGQEEKGLTEDEMVDGVTDSMDMVWVDSKSWWWTGRPGVLQSMGLQRVWHDWATELNWTDGLKKVWEGAGSREGSSLEAALQSSKFSTDPPTLLVGIVVKKTMENSIEVPRKTKNRVYICSRNPTFLGYLEKIKC